MDQDKSLFTRFFEEAYPENEEPIVVLADEVPWTAEQALWFAAGYIPQ